MKDYEKPSAYEVHDTTTSDRSVPSSDLLAGWSVERNCHFGFNYTIRLANGMLHKMSITEVLLWEILCELKGQGPANASLHRTEPAAGSGTVRGLVGSSEVPK